MLIDFAELSTRETYQLMTSVLVPRPIAWVGTLGVDGVPNLAPFSYFMGVSSSPPLIAISVARARHRALKDTAANVLATRELTVSIASWSLLQPMHDSSARVPPEVDEFAGCGLTAVPGEQVRAPRVGEAGVGLECRLHEAHDYGTAHLFVARVLVAHVADGWLVDGRVDVARLDPVARLGGTYARVGEEVGLPPARIG